MYDYDEDRKHGLNDRDVLCAWLLAAALLFGGFLLATMNPGPTETGVPSLLAEAEKKAAADAEAEDPADHDGFYRADEFY